MALVETVGSGLTYIGENLEENHVFGIEINLIMFEKHKENM